MPHWDTEDDGGSGHGVPEKNVWYRCWREAAWSRDMSMEYLDL